MSSCHRRTAKSSIIYTTSEGRLQANCALIFGNQVDYYDIDIETEDWEYYHIFVKRDFGDKIGPPIYTVQGYGEKKVWAKLERGLAELARLVELETPEQRKVRDLKNAAKAKEDRDFEYDFLKNPGALADEILRQMSSVAPHE